MRVTLETVISQNYATVAFIQCQDLPNALYSSIATLEINRLLVSSNNQSSTQSPLAAGSLDACIFHSGLDASPLDDESSLGNQFIFEQGILIPTQMNDSWAITTILVFNAALAHHLHSKRNNSSAHMLQRAQQLYEIAYESYDMDENVVFQFMVINNLAVIQRITGNVEASNQCFDYLLSLYMLFLDQGCHLQLHYVRGFVANIPLPNNTLASTAA